MYAIIETGGKQYKVAKDAVIDVELLDAEVGAQIEFKDVLLMEISHPENPLILKILLQTKMSNTNCIRH